MVMFSFFYFWSEIPFLGKFGPKCQNYHFKLKFGNYTNSNMQISVMMFTFSAFYQKYPFWVNLVQKVKIISLSWNLVSTLIRICRIQWCCSLFHFRTEIPFLGKFGSKSQNYQFKLKFGNYTNSNMQISVMMFTFSAFYQKYPFWVNLVQKVKIISLSWNLVPTLIRICRIQWCCWLFHFQTEVPFLGEFGPKNQNY